jgi:hypothetical protein
MTVDILLHISSSPGKSWMTGKMEKSGEEHLKLTCTVNMMNKASNTK